MISELQASGSVGCENATNERGERLIWLEDAMADRLGAIRGRGESYSDMILRIATQKIAMGACVVCTRDR